MDVEKAINKMLGKKEEEETKEEETKEEETKEEETEEKVKDKLDIKSILN
jgi:hypothetical protein